MGMTLYPPHRSGSGICLSRNFCFIRSNFDCKIDREEITSLDWVSQAPIWLSWDRYPGARNYLIVVGEREDLVRIRFFEFDGVRSCIVAMPD